MTDEKDMNDGTPIEEPQVEEAPASADAYQPPAASGTGMKMPSWLVPAVGGGLVLLVLFLLFGRSSGNQLLVGFPDKDGEQDVMLYRLGEDENDGIEVLSGVEPGGGTLRVYKDGESVNSIRTAGFIEGEKLLPLYYADGSDMVFEWFDPGKEDTIEVMDSDDNFYPSIYLDSDQVQIVEYRDDDTRCYLADIGEEADTVAKKIDSCFFSDDGKLLFTVERDDGDFKLIAITLSNEDEVELIDTDERIENYHVSTDGSLLAYVEYEDFDEAKLYVKATKDGDELYESDEFISIYTLQFAPGQDYGYFIAENDDGELELHVFGEGQDEDAIAEDIFMGVAPGPEGKYLVYYVGDEEDEITLFSYSYSKGKSEDFYDSDAAILVSSITYGERIMFVDIDYDDDEAQFYTVKFDGSDLVEVFDLDFDDYDLEDMFYIPDSNEVYLLFYDNDEDAPLALYVMPLDEEDAGYFLLEEWADIRLLTVDEKGETLVFAAAEDDGDDMLLYAIALEDGADEVELDDDVEYVRNAVFQPDGKTVLYTGVTGDKRDDVSIFEVPVDGEGKPDEVYEEAVLIAVSWGDIEVFIATLNFDRAYEGPGD